MTLGEFIEQDLKNMKLESDNALMIEFIEHVATGQSCGHFLASRASNILSKIKKSTSDIECVSGNIEMKRPEIKVSYDVF